MIDSDIEKIARALCRENFRTTYVNKDSLNRIIDRLWDKHTDKAKKLLLSLGNNYDT